MKPSTVSAIEAQTRAQSEEAVGGSIDELGLTETVVEPYGQGANEIIVELPGEGDPNRAKSVIQAGGQLELRRVQDPNPYPSEAAALGSHGGVLPPGTELLSSKTVDASGQGSWYLVDRSPIITGRDLRNASAIPSTDNPGSSEVNFTLSTDAPRRFGPFTEQNVGRPMAIVLDREVESAPLIRARVEDSGLITWSFAHQH